METIQFEYIPAEAFCIKVTDGTHDSPKKTENGKPLVTSKHIKGNNIDFSDTYLISLDDFNKINKRSKVDQWDVIISMIGEYCGYTYIEKNEFIDYAIKNVGLFKTGDKIKAFWLYYYLNSKIGKDTLKNLRTGTSQPYITLNSLRTLPILTTTNTLYIKKVISILSSLDEKIELNRQINKTLEEMAQTIFKQWFVDFEFPNEEGKPYKSGGGEMVDSELGKIPKGWEVGKIEDLFILQRGFDLPTHQRTEGLYPVVAASGISSYHNEYKIKAPGVTTGRSGIIGNVFYIQEDFWPLNTSLFIKEYKNSTPLYSFYILKYLNLPQLNAGSAVPTLNRNDVHVLSCLLPDMNIIKYFEKIVSDLFKNIFNNKKEIENLENIRDSLLPKLISGKLSVSGLGGLKDEQD